MAAQRHGRQLTSAAGSWPSAGTVRSGFGPIVSNGAAERFTQAVRMPAAPAPTLSNALQVTSRTCATGRASRLAACRYTKGEGLNTRISPALILWPKNPPRPLLSRQLLIMSGLPFESTASSYPSTAAANG